MAMPGTQAMATLPRVEFRIETRSETPTYRQLASQLKAAITSGELASGDFLPSIHDLMAATGLSQGTVQKAREALREEGLVATAPGRGVYVR